MRVRDDDVFVLSSGYPSGEQVVQRVKYVHEAIVGAGFTHVAAVLCHNLHEFPGGVEFLRDKTHAGELVPEVHGWEHVDYAKLERDEIVENLKRCIDVIQKTTHYDPTIFYTPWGANAPHIAEASRMVGLEMIDCSETMPPAMECFGHSKHWEVYGDLIRSEERELFIHWWQDRCFVPDSPHDLVKIMNAIRDGVKPL